VGGCWSGVMRVCHHCSVLDCWSLGPMIAPRTSPPQGGTASGQSLPGAVAYRRDPERIRRRGTPVGSNSACSTVEPTQTLQDTPAS
jgi:hypothetical protein